MTGRTQSEFGILRDALPALHQLGPRCFCESCEAHAALSEHERRLTAWRDSLALNSPNWSWIVREIDAFLRKPS